MNQLINQLHYRLIIGLLYCVLAFSAQATLNNITLEQLSVEHGLSQGTIKNIIQDDTGFLWFVNENGIDIYDGYKFKRFLGPNGVIKNNSVTLLKKDSQGVIWLNLKKNGLYTYNTQTNVFHQVIDHTRDKESLGIVDFAQDNDGNFWLASTKSIIQVDAQYNVVNEISFAERLSTSATVMSLAFNKSVLFVGTSEHVFAVDVNDFRVAKLPLITQNTGVATDYNAREIKRVFSIYAQDNSLYLGTNDGVLTLDISLLEDYFNNNASLPLYQLVGKNVSTWSLYPHQDSVYVASETGLWQLDKQSKKIKFLFGFSTEVRNLSDDNLRSILVDKQGTFWLGSTATGVYKWDPKTELITNFTHQKDEFGLSNNEIWTVLQDKHDADLVWVGSSNGLNAVNRKTKRIEKYFASQATGKHFSGNHMYKLYYFTDTILLVYSSTGVRFFDTATREFTHAGFDAATQALFVNSTGYVDKYGDIWFSKAMTIYHLDKDTRQVTNYNKLNPNTEPFVVIHYLGYLPGTDKLIFTSQQALWTIDRSSGKYRKLFQHPDVTLDDLLSVDNWTIDGDIFWIATYTKGLIGLSLNDFSIKYHYHSDNSILDNILYGMKVDSQGDIWFSSHSGVYLFNPKNHHVRKFLPRNGFNAIEFNSHSHETLSDGNFAFGSTSGVSIFDPIALKTESITKENDVYITSVEVLSNELSLPLVLQDNEVISLAYNDVGIKVSFSTFNFYDSNHVKYRYKLIGDKTLEYPPTYENSIIFPSLPSGTHVLEVQAQSPQTSKYSKTRRLVFHVGYTPWRSPLAYMVYTLILGVLFIGWLLYRKRQQNALLAVHEQVKQREERLQLALIGSNSEVWDWQEENNKHFSKRLTQELGYDHGKAAISQDEFIALIHPEDAQNYQTQWENYIASGSIKESFSVIYRLKSATGEWLWFKDFGKLVSHNQGETGKRITGSYRNITQSKVDDERAQYYGEVFQHTKDWVIIVDDEYSRMVVNQTYCQTFDIDEHEIEFSPQMLGFTEKQMQYYKNIASSIEQGENWRSEDTLHMPNGQSYYVIISISVSKVVGQSNANYLFVLTDISAQKKAEKDLRFLASYDQVTELPNRFTLLKKVEQAAMVSQVKVKSLALLLIDLDQFKQVNDSLGHVKGDMLLVEVAHRLRSILRANEFISRIGGDEFVVLIEDEADQKEISKVADKIIKQLQLPFVIDDNIVSVGASIGISRLPENGHDAQQLLSYADLAMYHAKKQGRNNFQYFSEQLNIEASERLTKESSIKFAQTNNEFINHYQPIIDATQDKMIGVELLLRWQKPTGLVGPNEFITIAEDLGLIIEMTEQAMLRGLQDLKQWQKTSPDFYLSINISAKHFVKDNLVSFFKTQIAAFGLSYESIRVEVTESLFISEPKKAISVMQELSALGVKLALDDFGTGYSSLAYLKALPLDILKIDRAFVAGLGKGSADEAIVESTLVLAKNLGMICIAEGVETAAQRDYFLERDCSLIQGFFYSKPVDAESIYQQITKTKFSSKA